MIINNKIISERFISQIVSDIKSKKELSGIDESFVKTEIAKIVSHSRKDAEFLSSAKDFEKARKSAIYKDVVKKARATLRKSVGVFIKTPHVKDFRRALLKHESSRERIEIYPEIYKRIFHITGIPKSISDLGCGLNPLSYEFLGAKPEYFASDIDSGIVGIVNDFFKSKRIKGKAEVINLRAASIKLPKADICLMFKLLDSIEIGSGHKLAEKLIKSVPCKWIVASFSTKTISGKKMNHPHRGWIEQLCRRLGYFYEIIEFENEIFYLIQSA